MGAVSAGLSVAGAVGSVAAAEGRMCGLASCFTAGTQVVVGEETIESACGTEIVQVQSFDGSNIAFAGLCIGFAVISVSINRKKKDHSMNSNRHTSRASTSFDEGENPLPIENDFTEKSNSCEKSWSFLRPVLATILFSIAILCGYFALPTTKSVAVSTPTAQVIKRYITKNIEDVQVGDEVYAYNIETGETVKRRVINAVQRSSNHLRYLTVQGTNGVQTFETTDSHPFWVVTDTPDLSRAARENVEDNGVSLHHENLGITEKGYYVEAGDLQVSDIFVCPSGGLTTLEETVRTEFPDGITVYNFEVEDDHNYFVIANLEAFQNGVEPILVHNANCIHGNSKLSERPATLYARFEKNGNFLKWGISWNPDTRYSKTQLKTDHLETYMTGSRSEMLDIERDLAETIPGPMNRERWAGSRIPKPIE
jgi:hypothetical protein